MGSGAEPLPAGTELTTERMWDIVQRQTTMRLVYRALGVELVRPATVRLADGTVGYCVRAPRKDDCFAAALATVLQVPIGDVPDPRLDDRVAAGETVEEIDRSAWSELNEWLYGRGLRMTLHTELPPRRRRWMGVVPMAGDFQDHSLVFDRREVLFDPAIWQPVSGGEPIADTRVCEYGFDDVTIGYSFRSTNRNPNTRRT